MRHARMTREEKLLQSANLNDTEAAADWSRGLGRWSLMREVQSSNLRRGYIPHVGAIWHGVTPPDWDPWQEDR